MQPFAYSNAKGQCVECASAAWSKASYSLPDNNNRVECAHLSTAVALRDSKNPDHGHLTLPPAEWTAFLAAAKDGDL
ncbi:hypothetical protein GCM10027294_19000 [Marinactinospora endophytica]|uniref:DUF397 domain-containing protein n=1 Tax=Marinactinospora thermotolerans TaxID=531310 RepID=UPI001F3FFBA6|nr:DUF397 domain-containing protein [Marinactinospora thermotolerans]